MSLAIRQATAMTRAGMRGDPGLGKILGGLGKGLIGAITGGPIGAVAGFASSFLGGGGKPTALPGGTPILPPAQGFTTQQFGTSTGRIKVGPVEISGPQISIPGFGPGGTVTVGTPGACVPGMRGVRLNKTGYFLKSGQYVPPGSRCVKVRRRNPLNPRALSRAMSRLTSFKRAAESASRISVRSGCGCKRR